MADIELVIKIPEGLKKDFESEQWTALSCMEMKYALEKATPLPKGHGRLIDADRLKEEMEKDVRRAMSFVDLTDFIWLAPTIIEADKGSEVEQ